MPCQCAQISLRSHSHATRLEVAAQRARRYCRQNQQDLLSPKHFGAKAGCASTQDGWRDRADTAMRTSAGGSPGYPGRLGHNYRACVQPGRPVSRRCREGLGREVWKAWRSHAVRLANAEGCLAGHGGHETAHQPSRRAFSAFAPVPIESHKPEEVDKDSALSPGSGEVGRTSAWRSVWNSGGLALEATSHIGGPCRKSCGNREGGS